MVEFEAVSAVMVKVAKPLMVGDTFTFFPAKNAMVIMIVLLMVGDGFIGCI